MRTKWHTFSFMVCEKKPEDSDHPQGDRVLDGLSFSFEGMKIQGKSRFKKFEAILCMPQDGSLVPAQAELVEQKKDFFEVKFINPSQELLKKIAWWDPPATEEQLISPPSDQSADIGV